MEFRIYKKNQKSGLKRELKERKSKNEEKWVLNES